MSLLRSVLFFSLQIVLKNDCLVSSLDLREPQGSCIRTFPEETEEDEDSC